MKILFVTSFYSAITDSVILNKWSPSGMPAITKLYETLFSEKHKFDNIYIDRSANKNDVNQIHNNRFNNQNSILSFSNTTNLKYFTHLKQTFNSILIIRYVYNKICNHNYNLLYVDRANLLVGACLAYFGYDVVLRLHGVNVLFENFSKLSYRIMNPLKLVAMYAPFKCIIATKDGSPSDQFLMKYSRNKSVYTLLNGIDEINNLDLKRNNDLNIPDDLPVFLFVSRLTEDKGIMDLIYTIIALKDYLNDFYTIIVGDGECFDKVKALIDENSLNNILLTGAVNHSLIYEYYNYADVYISLNKIGNLSNTVLEAVNSGKCIITFNACKNSFRDISTINFFKDAALYIDRHDIINQLMLMIVKLIYNPQLIADKKYQILKCKTKLDLWNIRIKKELKLILKHE